MRPNVGRLPLRHAINWNKNEEKAVNISFWLKNQLFVPESRRRRGIAHRAGGAHELEGKTKDLYSTAISHKDLLAAAHRRDLRKRKEQEKQP